MHQNSRDAGQNRGHYTDPVSQRMPPDCVRTQLINTDTPQGQLHIPLSRIAPHVLQCAWCIALTSPMVFFRVFPGNQPVSSADPALEECVFASRPVETDCCISYASSYSKVAEYVFAPRIPESNPDDPIEPRCCPTIADQSTNNCSESRGSGRSWVSLGRCWPNLVNG